MLYLISVALRERAIVHSNELPLRYLRPGRHWVFAPFKRVEVVRVSPDALVATLRPEQLALVPAGELVRVPVANTERGVIRRHGRAVKWLAPGEHQVWTVDPAVRVEVFPAEAVVTEPLADDLKLLAPAADYAETLVPEGAVALRYVDGVLDAVLPPGRHAAWTTRRQVRFAVIDRRERLLHVTGQEVMTRDRVSLRLNLTAALRVTDPRKLATVAQEADAILYLAMQLAAREAVAGQTLDQLLANRQSLSGSIAEGVAARAAEVGLALVSFGLKDVVLPGEMKALLNRVIEAQKEAEANVILRREETAATRSLAQTAQVLAENPLLMRLKELEAYKELAAKVGQVHVVLGEGAIPALQLRSPS